MTACTPAVTGIRVNGQSTNTIIAGTNGFIEIYGTCLGSARSVEVDGVGITTSSTLTFDLVNYPDAQVDGFFQASSAASGGVHNVRVATINGMSPVVASAQVFVTAITLESFKLNSGLPLYYRDCAGNKSPITEPTSPAPAFDSASNPCPQQFGLAGDHGVFVAGQKMAGTATFTLTPPITQSIPGVYVEGPTLGAFGTFSASDYLIQAGSTFSIPVTTNNALPSQTQSFNLTTNWSVAQAGGTCLSATFGCTSAGSAFHPIFVTLAPKVLPGEEVMLTYVSLAVANGGATDIPTAVANTWAKFTTGGINPAPANVTTWDGRQMFYYSGGFDNCAINARDIVLSPGNPSYWGQCGAFAYLLESSFAMNGIHSYWTQINASDRTTSNEVKMVIKNWDINAPTYSSETSPYKYKLEMNSTGDYMYGTPPNTARTTNFGDLSYANGKPGQGYNLFGQNPVEKIFDFHFIVCLPTSNIAPNVLTGPIACSNFFDPSYGVTYASQVDFESKAVAGYAMKLSPDTSASGFFHFAPAPLGNITFSINIGKSY